MMVTTAKRMQMERIAAIEVSDHRITSETNSFESVSLKPRNFRVRTNQSHKLLTPVQVCRQRCLHVHLVKKQL